MSLRVVAVWLYEAVLWPRPWHGNVSPRLKASMRRAWSIGRVQTGYIYRARAKIFPNIIVPLDFHFVVDFSASLVFMGPI